MSSKVFIIGAGDSAEYIARTIGAGQQTGVVVVDSVEQAKELAFKEETSFAIAAPPIISEHYFTPPPTRAERRAAQRKHKKRAK